MNRTDRLYAIAEELRAADERGRTASSLAEQFEVSTRTIKRDVSTLQQAGLPIWARPGRAGGYRMLRSSTSLPPLRLRTSEATAIALALHVAREMPYAVDGSTALTKILASMPTGERERFDDLTARIWRHTAERRPGTAAAIDDAIAAGHVIGITYEDADGTTTRRAVDPLALAHTSGHWYLLAHCHLRRAGRWFRLDRIRRVAPTGRPRDEHDLVELFGAPPEHAGPIRPARAGTGPAAMTSNAQRPDKIAAPSNSTGPEGEDR